MSFKRALNKAMKMAKPVVRQRVLRLGDKAEDAVFAYGFGYAGASIAGRRRRKRNKKQ